MASRDSVTNFTGSPPKPFAGERPQAMGRETPSHQWHRELELCWHVRIEWQHAPDITWPQLTHNKKMTKEEAEDEARKAINYGEAGRSLWAVRTSIRAPGALEWQEVACRPASAGPTQTATQECT